MRLKNRSNFAPQLTRDEALTFSELYNLDGDALAESAGAAIREGDFSPGHLRAIFKWKTRDRGKSRLTGNSDIEIENALSLATRAATPRSTIAVLTGLYGIDVPVASAVMTVVRPEIYTILDFRALQALGSSTGNRSLPFSLESLGYWAKLANEWGLAVRQQDRAILEMA